ncbi:MAG: GAF domain-containing protein [Pseudomonadota bacterium]
MPTRRHVIKHALAVAACSGTLATLPTARTAFAGAPKLTFDASLVPRALKELLARAEPTDAFFSALMRRLTLDHNCDRTFIYMRDPQSRLGAVTHAQVRDPKRPTLIYERWSVESPGYATLDPMFVTAQRTPRAVIVDDIETAAPGVLNRAHERDYFAHRALIHAPIWFEGRLFGILEPCVFDAPRRWSARDAAITAATQIAIAEATARYVAAAVARVRGQAGGRRKR